MSDSQLAQLPPEVLAGMPLSQAPDGLHSNLVNPTSLAPIYHILGGILLAIAIGFGVIRFYTKARITAKYSYDDWTFLAALITTIVIYAFVTHAGDPLGRHIWDISVFDAIQKKFELATWLGSWMASISLMLTKCSFFLLYLQVFRPNRALRVAIYVGLAITILFYMSTTIVLLVILTPHRGQSWLAKQSEAAVTGTSVKISTPISAVGVAIDFYTLAIPIFGVMGLQMSLKYKLGVMVVFMTGLVACVASIICLFYRVKLQHNTGDTIYYGMAVTISAFVEITVGLSCSCMPASAKFLRHHLPVLQRLSNALSYYFTSAKSSLLGSRSSNRRKNQSGYTDVESFRASETRGRLDRNVGDSNASQYGQSFEMGQPNSVKTFIDSNRHQVHGGEDIQLQYDIKQTWSHK